MNDPLMQLNQAYLKIDSSLAVHLPKPNLNTTVNSFIRDAQDKAELL